MVDAWQLLRPHVRDEFLCTREGGLGSAAIDDIPVTDHDGYRHGDAAQLVVGEHGRRRDSPEPTGQHAHRDQVDARVCGRVGSAGHPMQEATDPLGRPQHYGVITLTHHWRGSGARVPAGVSSTRWLTRSVACSASCAASQPPWDMPITRPLSGARPPSFHHSSAAPDLTRRRASP
ncbi:MAG: hypothetical protein QOI28_2888 [Mycobacterium sp.]|nr:hypothetical protein [Mycobacterium sp.]MDT5190637.1 hypothetical protein [Mycobacterium sp.]